MKMSKEIILPSDTFIAESRRLEKKALKRDRVFVLLLGPSAVGKSTIISELNKQSSDYSFTYVSPYVTRPNRPGETDKISVSEEEFQQMEDAGEFVVVNNLYGVRYGTPFKGILGPLTSGNNPILDYPLATVDALKSASYDLLNVYIYPPSVREWRHRIESSNRNIDGRLEAGLKELGSLAVNNFQHPAIDLSLINKDGQSDTVARQIASVLNDYTH